MLTHEQLATHFSANLEKERIRLNLSQAEMAKLLGLSISSYKRFSNLETHRIDAYTVYRLSRLTGKTFSELCGDPHPISQTCRMLRKLSAPQLRFVNAIIEFEACFASSELESDDYTTLLAPSGSTFDGMICDTFSYQKLHIADYRNRFEAPIDCALLITSDHLAPFYYKDDILLVSHTPVRDGDVGIFVNKVTGLLYIRRLRDYKPWHLESLTYDGHSLTIDKDTMSHWIIFGRVLTRMRI